MTRSDSPQTGRFLAFDDVDGFRLEELRPGVNHLGSGFDASIVIARAAGVSPRHAVVVVDADGTVEVADDRSREGTWVNERRVEREPLQPGDTLRLGSIVLTLVATKALVAVPLRQSLPELIDMTTRRARRSRPNRRYRRLIPTAAAAAALLSAGPVGGAAMAAGARTPQPPQVAVAPPADSATPITPGRDGEPGPARVETT
jgi:FHA domain-containing protein